MRVDTCVFLHDGIAGRGSEEPELNSRLYRSLLRRNATTRRESTKKSRSLVSEVISILPGV